MWKPGAPKPTSSSSSSSSSSKKRKRKKNTETSQQNELIPLQKPAQRDPSKPLLSGTIKTMKFMQRQTETANAARAKRDRERAEQERHWVIDHPDSASFSSSSSSSSSNTTNININTNPKGFVVIRDTQSSSLGPMQSLSRRSFRGFNANVERHHVGIRREREAIANLNDVEDIAIGDEEMARTLGGNSKSDQIKIDDGQGNRKDRMNRKRKGNDIHSKKSTKGRRTFG